ncbi:MAG: hypothetical protein QXU99_02960 [Candidatus Bathyarchaeia archaeon]
MKKVNCKAGMTSILLVILITSLAQSPIAYSSEPTVQEKALAFLNEVVGFDLSKYIVKLDGVSTNYQSTFGPLVKEEGVDYILDSGTSKVQASFVFENGLLWYCDISFLNGIAIYRQSPSTNVLEQAKGLFQKYQSYINRNYETDTSYTQSMQNMLDSISELKPLEKTQDNIKLQITSKKIDPAVSNTVSTVVKWIYTENGIDIPRKSVAMYFRNETFWFMSDSWNLVTIGSHSLISEEEAVSLAWEKAKNYTLKFASENGSTIEVKPDLSDVTTEVTFSMTTRNSTALYPLWTINFYFNKAYYSAYGIQVSLWGDTKEIIYCESLITLGNSTAKNAQEENPTAMPSNMHQPEPSSLPENNPINPTAPTTTPTPDTNLMTEGNTNPAMNTYLIAGITAIGIAVAAAAVTFKKRKGK